MRLITHNLLKCNIRGLEEGQGYPLRIQSETTEVIPMDFNEELVKNLIRKINFHTLASALRDLAIGETVLMAIEERKELTSAEIASFFETNQEYWKALHSILFEFHLINGVLVCPTTNREFLVRDGIPNMLLHEDEV